MTDLQEFTNRIGIEPDGRSLHAYRLDEEQYCQFEKLVRKSLKLCRFQSAAVPFLLWAAERYRKGYVGGTLSWEFLTQVPEMSLPRQQLREITGIGLGRLLFESSRNLPLRDKGASLEIVSEALGSSERPGFLLWHNWETDALRREVLTAPVPRGLGQARNEVRLRARTFLPLLFRRWIGDVALARSRVWRLAGDYAKRGSV